MRVHVETIKRRLDAINQLRLERARASSGPVLHRIYSLLPLLLHYNHPIIPGYIEGKTPHGLCFYTVNEQQQQFLDDCASIWGSPIQPTFEGKPSIAGLYSMGSTSSIGQNPLSDLDLWVFPQCELTSNTLMCLHEKCGLLSQWAKMQGVTITFFIIDKNHFRNNQHGVLSHENCGSTQQKLLLEEFYRTAVRLAGKWMIWYLVPVRMEAHYDEYLQSLYERGVLNQSEWIDLGGLDKLSAEEYFSATHWQLYTSIDSPYKAILKNLLLEAYTWEYPHAQLLALDLKQCLHSGLMISFGLDPYYMILERVTHYLQAINDTVRVDLVRRCFYLKVRQNLIHQQTGTCWRQEILRQLVKQWEWAQQRIEYLDNRANWKIEVVREAHNELVAAMVQSYRNLKRFSQRNNLCISATSQDIDALTRKLYTTFKGFPNKIGLVNTQISPDLSEKEITFIYSFSGINKRYEWYLYRGAPIPHQGFAQIPLEHNRYLSKLVAWAHFNGLLIPATKINLTGTGAPSSLNKLSQFITDLRYSLPICSQPSCPQTFHTPSSLHHLVLIINLETDPTSQLSGRKDQMGTSASDVFNFGPRKTCLIGSVALIYHNSWNEVLIQHCSGLQLSKAINSTLKALLQPDILQLPKVEVLCYSDYAREMIKKQVLQCTQSVMANAIHHQPPL